MKRPVLTALTLIVLAASVAAQGKGDNGVARFGIGFDLFGFPRRSMDFRVENFEYVGVDCTGVRLESQMFTIEGKSSIELFHVGLYFRVGRFKFGWLPIVGTDNPRLSPDTILYNHTEPGRPRWPLGLNSMKLKQTNFGYVELIGARIVSLSEPTVLRANVMIRADRISLSGSLKTMRFPFGVEWFHDPIVVTEQMIDEQVWQITFAPKLAVDARNKGLLEGTPLAIVKGIDFSFGIEMRTNEGQTSWDFQFRPAATLTLEFP